MNKYKIEMKKILKKDIIVNADDENEALNFIEKIFLKTSLLDLSDEDIESVEAKIVEKNNGKAEEKLDISEKELEENLNDILEEGLEKIREKVPEKYRKFYCPDCGYPIYIDEVIEEFMS